MPVDDVLLTPREVAELLGVRTATVGWWVRTGALRPFVRTPGGHRRYRRSDVEAFSDSAKIEPDTERERMERDAVRLYQQGWSIRQVAARFGCGYGAMRRILLPHTTLRDQNAKEGAP
jgi:excisionase family DNA binding protein